MNIIINGKVKNTLYFIINSVPETLFVQNYTKSSLESIKLI